MSLTSCMKQAGSAMRAEDKAAIFAGASAYRKEGLKPDPAGIQSARDQLAVAEKLMAKEQAKEAKPVADEAPALTSPTKPQSAPETQPSNLPEIANAIRLLRNLANKRLIPDETTLRAVITTSLVGADRALNVNPKRYELARVLGLKVKPIPQLRSTALELSIESGDSAFLNQTLAEINSFIQEEGKRNAPTGVREQLLKSEQKDNENSLTSPTKADILTQQQAKEDGEKASAKAKRDTDKKLADEQTAKDNASRFAGAVENFKLGETADQNLSGQDAMFARGTAQPAQPFYSALTRGVEGINAKALTGAMWADGLKGLVNKGTAKADEIEWSGITDWLKLQDGKVSKEQVLNYLDGNGVKIDETMLGKKPVLDTIARNMGFGGWSSNLTSEQEQAVIEESKKYDHLGDNTKYGQYQLPGGENYKELLLTLPDRAATAFPTTFEDWKAQRLAEGKSDSFIAWKQAKGKFFAAEDRGNNYKSSHWDQKNILAHIRFNERTDAEGKRVLFIEEIQSDWAQEGKKKGFTEPTEKLTAKLVGKWNAGKDAQGKWEVFAGDQSRGYFEGNSADEAIEEANSRRVIKTPVGPFVGKTDAWVSLALKRMVSYAAENGFDKVAFVNGGQSAERYDLSKQVDSISYVKDGSGYRVRAKPVNGGSMQDLGVLSAEKLSDAVGKEVAEKIVRGDGIQSGDNTILSGIDLKVGGEGMKAFYDKIVPTVAKDVLRKLGGGQMTTASIASDKQGWHITPPEQTTSGKWMLKSSDYNSKGLQFDTEAEAQAALKDKQPSSTQLAFDITPAMREKAAAGLPLFSRIDSASQPGDTAANGTPDTRPEAAANIGVLGSSIADYAGIARAKVNALHPYDARVLPGDAALREIAQAFGSRIQGFDLSPRLLAADRTRFGFFTGVRTGGIVFINSRNADRAHIAVLGHELAHELATKNPALYQQFVDAVRPYVDQQKYSTAFVNSVVAKNAGNTDKQREEFMGEVLSDGFMDREFWRALGNKNPSLLQKIGNSVMDLVERALRTLGYTKRTEPYLTDYKKVMQIAGEVMAEFGVAPTRAAGADTRFAAADDTSFSRGTANLFQPNIWSAPADTRTDKIIYNLQDQKIDLKRVQEVITKSGQAIDEKWDARLAETLYPGRVAHRSQTFLEVEAQPLLEAMTRNKVGMDELADYLHARGAEERNVQIAKVNPAMPDGGAGTNTKGTLLTTQAAKDYLTAISPTRKMVLDAMAKRVDAITAGTRTLLVTEGLEKQETIDAWTAAYKNYVPMFRDEADEGFPSHPQGSGFTVKGSASKRAMGSKKEVTNILAHVLMQREAAITRAEKNRVALALYGQALSHPNPEFWTTIKPGMQAAAIASELVAMGVDPMTAEVGMAGVPTIQTIDPNSGKVVNRPNPMYKMLPGAIPLKVNGEDRVLMLNVKNERGARLATSLKNLDGLTNLDLAGSIVGRATRFLAAVNTQYNPAFGLVNLTRDTLGGVIHLGNTELRGNSLKVLAQTPMAILGIARELATGKQAGKWGKLYQQFVADGGQTGFKENFRDPNDRAKAIEKELKALGRGALSPGKYAHAALDLLDGFNTTLENAVRLSAYSAALDKGISRPQAARLGRELTVDFNRKGRLGREVGPLYAFFNASVQGMARTMQAIKGPTGGKIIAGGLSLGILQALMLAAAGYDDDEIPEFVKTRALIIPVFGDKKEFISIPYPLGLHVLPNTGRVLTELVLNGGKDIGKRSVDAIGEIAGAFNPLGGGNILTADGALKSIAPTLLDPIIEVVANKNFAGSSIEKRGFGAETDNRPGVNRVRESTQRSTTGQAYMGISKAMNTATGGSDYEAGAVSPTPEMVRYLAQTVGGGVLREIEKTINASTASVRGDKVKASQIPVMGRFYGEVENDDVQRSRYFKTDQEMKKLTSVSRELKKSGTDADMDAYEKKHPELEAVRDWQRAERRIAKLNKLAVETINDPKELRSIDADRAEEMRNLNQTLLDMEKATGKTTPAEEVRKAAVKAGWK